jgi:hypothetical protein
MYTNDGLLTSSLVLLSLSLDRLVNTSTFHSSLKRDISTQNTFGSSHITSIFSLDHSSLKKSSALFLRAFHQNTNHQAIHSAQIVLRILSDRNLITGPCFFLLIFLANALSQASTHLYHKFITL